TIRRFSRTATSSSPRARWNRPRTSRSSSAIHRRGTEMRVSIAGAGQVGRSIARELMANGHQVTLIEREGAAIKPDSVLGATWLHADACELASLEELGLEHYDVAI